jgi:hypothetical protein
MVIDVFQMCPTVLQHQPFPVHGIVETSLRPWHIRWGNRNVAALAMHTTTVGGDFTWLVGGCLVTF